MYYKRLASTTTQNSRSKLQEKKIKSKILFFVEGVKTELIYLHELKKSVPASRNIDIEIFDRWKDLSGESNQLNIVLKTKEYLEKCRSISPKNKRRIERTLLLLEHNQWSIDEMLKKIEELNRFIGHEILSTKDILMNQLMSIKTCYDFDKSMDKICFVLDRDCGSFTPSQYDDVLEICNGCGYELGISTPNFEFFLILHLSSLDEVETEEIFENRNEFTYKKLKELSSETFQSQYKKERYNAKLFIDNFNTYKENIINYSQDNVELKDSIGSSLGIIIDEIIN